MAPTLLIGDHVPIDKTRTAPSVGDVVVGRSPVPGHQRVLARVIATAGQRVEVRAGGVWLDGAKVPRCDVGPARLVDPTLAGDAAAGSALVGEIWLERLGARAWLTIDAVAETVSRDGRSVQPRLVRAHAGPWTVKPGEVFVLGDDRDQARDSRSWLGDGAGLPLANVEGRVFALLYADTATAVRFDDRAVLVERGAILGALLVLFFLLA